MTITRELLLEFLASDNERLTYKSHDTGSGLGCIQHFGYVYMYSTLGKTSKKRIDKLAKTLVEEIKALDKNTTPNAYYENTYHLFKERLVNEYVLEQVKHIKADRNKLANIVLSLKTMLNSDLIERIQDYKEKRNMA